jgi:hypothetical protein
VGSQFVTGVLDTIQQALTQTNESGNAPVLLMLGAFKFSLNTAVFQERRRSTEYRWAAIPQFQDVDALQYVGLDDTMSLPGVVYPDFRGDDQQIERLRAIASLGKPQRLIDSDGSVLGYWVITQVTDTSSFFKADGGARKQEFDVSLRFYGTDLPQ